MGTRNLTCVVYNREYKVAQYGQWDGYFSGQGANIVNFLIKEGNIEKLKNNLSKVRFINDELDKEFIEIYNANVDTDSRTSAQKRWYDNFISRDIGGGILENIAEADDEEILLRNDIEFAEDSLFCEFAYVVNLDEEILECYIGFNHNPLDKTERFYKDNFEKEYYPVRLYKKIKFSDLTNMTMDEMEKEYRKEKTKEDEEE